MTFKRAQSFQSALFGILVLASMFVITNPAFPQTSDLVSATEKQLFARDFAAEPIGDRLSRIESMIFGQASSGDPAQRQAKIEAFMQQNFPQKPADLPRPKPTEEGAFSPPREKDATDYPTVTQLESRLFQQTYTDEEISKRLTRLEQAVFHQTYDELPMVDRVDQLTLKVIPNSPLGVEEGAVPNSALPNTGREFAPSSFAVYSQLTALEEHVFGRCFAGELVQNRLVRLEKRVFGAPQKGSIDSRLSNLINNYNRYQQSMPSQGTVGRPQAYTPSNPSMGGNPSPYPPQVMIGGSIGQSGYSQEFMDMLPGGAQQRIQMQGSGTAVGLPVAPDTPFYNVPDWPQQQPYQAPPSLYRPPGQIYQPYSMQQQQQTYPPAYSNMPPQMQYQPNSGLNVNQSLILLEHQVFGQSYDGGNIQIRLNNLEQQVFGQTYPQLSFEERINHLMQQSGYHQS
jgi:hypothetical protein